jgi:DNA-binding transcriptional ArsR family regulator
VTDDTATMPGVLSVLADETRWRILSEIGAADLSASALAGRLPVSRQAIAKHLAVLAEAGLVESVRAGREIRYRALGSRLSALANDLDAIGRRWERRLEVIKRIAERAD